MIDLPESYRPLQLYRCVLTQAQWLWQDFLAFLPGVTTAQSRLKRHKRACAEANRVLSSEPSNLDALHKLGNALCALKRYRKAIAYYDRALAVAPDSGAIWRDRETAIAKLGPLSPASAAGLDLTSQPKDADGWTIRAGALHRAGRLAEASAASDRALELDPENLAAARIGIQSRVVICDWRQRDGDIRRVVTGLQRGERIINPLTLRTMRDSDEEHYTAARLWTQGSPPPETPLWNGETYRHDKIRIAYVSADFVTGPVSSLIAGFMECHDKLKFEIAAISVRASDQSEVHSRIESAVDHFLDAHAFSNADVAKIIRELEIDIAINLNGFPGHPRNGIFARRPAPVQVTFLGYPGTTGAPYFDYILADPIVIPESMRACYSEKVAHMPVSFMPNDRRRRIGERKPTRSELGLPETGFVFACFHEKQKLNPVMFDIWMRLLNSVEGSVLWLRFANSAVVDNLRREAKARGIAPERLVFARRVPQLEDYLATLTVADLFLDGYPYNAHSTACDALWAGLPCLTYRGNSFASRVAASVLCALGMSELVTSSLEEYQALALLLAREPQRLAAIRAKLARNRMTEPLFDTARFTRHLETVYATMWERHRTGLPPVSFGVSA